MMIEEQKAVEQHAIGLARQLLKLANDAVPSDDKSPETIGGAQQAYASFAVENGWVIAQCLLEALSRRDGDIAALQKQSRGHFEAMTAVLRDGIEAVMPETPPKKAN